MGGGSVSLSYRTARRNLLVTETQNNNYKIAAAYAWPMEILVSKVYGGPFNFLTW